MFQFIMYVANVSASIVSALHALEFRASIMKSEENHRLKKTRGKYAERLFKNLYINL